MDKETKFLDNRPHIQFDAERIQTWELMALENQRINDMILIFSRHLANGQGLVSPGLPDSPLDELTAEQLAEIKASEAYQVLRRYPLSQLRTVSRTFLEAMQNYDPN